MATTRTANLSNCCAATHYTVRSMWPTSHTYQECNTCGKPCTVITWKLTPVVDPIDCEKHGLQDGCRYLFQDGFSRQAWSATVLEVTPTHVYIRYDTGSLTWRDVRDFIKRNDGTQAQVVLQQLQSSAITAPQDGASTPSEGTHPAGSDNN